MSKPPARTRPTLLLLALAAVLAACDAGDGPGGTGQAIAIEVTEERPVDTPAERLNAESAGPAAPPPSRNVDG